MAERTTEKALENARQATIAGGEDQFLTLARGDMEGLVRANRALADGASELGRAWLVCWQEQVAEGMELARAMLERQGAFLRSSLERMTDPGDAERGAHLRHDRRLFRASAAGQGDGADPEAHGLSHRPWTDLRTASSRGIPRRNVR